MEIPIFWLLMWNNPQVIQDLDDYQVKTHRTHLDIPPMPEEREPVIPIHTNLEEIDKLMREPPGHWRPPK